MLRYNNSEPLIVYHTWYDFFEILQQRMSVIREDRFACISHTDVLALSTLKSKSIPDFLPMIWGFREDYRLQNHRALQNHKKHGSWPIIMKI